MFRRSRRFYGLVASCLVSASEARSECWVTPSSDGSIAALLAAGPFPHPRVRPVPTIQERLRIAIPGVDPATVVPAVASPSGTLRWIPAAQPNDEFDVQRVLHGQQARSALLAMELVNDAPFEGYLFAGSDDGLVLWIDGTERYRYERARELREDDDLIPLSLTPGHHRVVLRQTINGGDMRVALRIVDRGFRATSAVRVLLPGVNDTTCDGLARAALRTAIRREVTSIGYGITARIGYPGGAPHRTEEQQRAIHLTLGNAHEDAALSLREPLRDARLYLAADATTNAVAELQVEDPVGTFSARQSVEVPSQWTTPLRRSWVLLRGMNESAPPSWLPLGSLTSLRFVADRLAELIADDDTDREHLNEEAQFLSEAVRALEAQRDPYRGRTGALRRAYRSAIDGTLQGYSLYVPPSYRDRPTPLVVALHGLHGSAHRMLPILFGHYDEHESRTHADRHFPTLPDAPGLLLAPYGRGDAYYRGVGERDVLDAIEAVRAAYRVDPDRTYMTGLSMGGIGAASIPFHYPDLFAAAAPLCGYHSYFVRRDTEGVRRPWEEFLMAARSNANWAENGALLPLYVVHGTRDTPTANSRSLVDRYTELGFRIESEWPNLGHNVWSTTYANGRIFPYFLRFRRESTPRRVRFVSAGPRWRTSWWVSIDREIVTSAWARIDAEVRGTTIQVSSENIQAFTLDPPASLFPAGARNYRVRIGRSTIEGTPGTPLSVQQGTQNNWATAPRETATVVGNPREFFDRPVLVVYGTQRADETEMNRRVAEHIARLGYGIRARIPVLADTALTAEQAQANALVLVGTRASHSYLARVADRLPLTIQESAIVAGSTRHTGAGIGATFTARNPEVPVQSLMVVTGTDVLGVWRYRFLPSLIPDFLIYDEAVAPARGRVLLGANARVRAAGFYRSDGTIEQVQTDPLPPATR